MDSEFCFPKSRRLVKSEVEGLLRDGARLGQDALGLRLLQNDHAFGRIAIAVPKRILKLAVDRNRIKRVIREAFRQHDVRRCNIDVLITLRSKVTIAVGLNDHMSQDTIGVMCVRLFDKVSRRFEPSR